uniref:Uncharacterized protein n=1 Tax=Timema poppense TaxID=170557 RepID=A0A7R9CUG3_TIMPO|nr:unnamed protein product [Timema poppensis]
METCDISLVKQEIVELIKTEPQNEDGFNMYGQSGIKTEDESDTSNSVDEILKTEIKLYESALGIMNSSIDHLTPLDKSEEDIVYHMEEEDNWAPPTRRGQLGARAAGRQDNWALK